MLIDEVKRRLYETHGNGVSIDESTFVGFKKHARFIDFEFGEWTAHVYAVCRGGRHPKRFQETKKIGIIKAQEKLCAVFGETVMIDVSEYTGACNECTFVDCEFGPWRTTLHELLKSKGHPERAKLARAESNRWTVAELNDHLKTIDGGRVTLVGDYVNMITPATFRDSEYGEFEALPLNVIHHRTSHAKRSVQRRSETMQEHFGVPHHMQNDVQFLKHLKNQRKHIQVPYWQTQQMLHCMNGWEAAVVRYLNERQIEFLWQPKAFRMPDGRTYRPDLFLIKENKWVEIKGYFPEKSREKWIWFQSVYPNSELWDKLKLIELKIL